MSDQTENLEAIRVMIGEIESCLPDEIRIADLTLNSKLPFKALSLRETLLFRMHELSETAHSLFEAKKAVSAVILTRAAMETLAIQYSFNNALVDVIENQDYEKFDTLIMRMLFGCRNKKLPHEAVNILNHIDKLDKKYPKIREGYDFLSEFAHPNNSGVHNTYSELDKEKLVLKLTSSRNLNQGMFVPYLGLSLRVFIDIYNESGNRVREFNDLFD